MPLNVCACIHTHARTSAMTAKDKRGITAAEMKFMKQMVKYTWMDQIRPY